MENDIDNIVKLMQQSNNTVIVTGAGISTEAGIPDFRGENGIYRKLGEDYVMNIINITYFRRYPEKFYKFYREHFKLPQVEPAKIHKVLVDMELKGLISCIVTQNVDNLHQKAGSKNVYAIHGTRARYICTDKSCAEIYDASYAINYPEVVPRCSKCDEVIKPDVVLFGEGIQHHNEAETSIINADLVIVLGSSLQVYPLAGFVQEFSYLNRDLVIINKGPTALDDIATLKIDTSNTGNLMEAVYDRLHLLPLSKD